MGEGRVFGFAVLVALAACKPAAAPGPAAAPASAPAQATASASDKVYITLNTRMMAATSPFIAVEIEQGRASVLRVDLSQRNAAHFPPAFARGTLSAEQTRALLDELTALDWSNLPDARLKSLGGSWDVVAIDWGSKRHGFTFKTMCPCGTGPDCPCPQKKVVEAIRNAAKVATYTDPEPTENASSLQYDGTAPHPCPTTAQVRGGPSCRGDQRKMACDDGSSVEYCFPGTTWLVELKAASGEVRYRELSSVTFMQ
jgi:hypothetical protein